MILLCAVSEQDQFDKPALPDVEVEEVHILPRHGLQDRVHVLRLKEPLPTSRSASPRAPAGPADLVHGEVLEHTKGILDLLHRARRVCLAPLPSPILSAALWQAPKTLRLDTRSWTTSES